MLEAAQGRRGSDRPDGRQIVRRENRIRVLVGNVHVTETPMGHRAAHEGDFTRAGHPEISNVLAAPAQKSVVLLAQNGSPDTLARHAETLACGARQRISVTTPVPPDARRGDARACSAMPKEAACKRCQGASS